MKSKTNILKKLFLFNKKYNDNNLNHDVFDQYKELAKLVQEVRVQKNLTIAELSRISKIPERIIKSIEDNDQNIRPKYPFIRSILIKLEECLELKKNTLVKIAIVEVETSNKKNKNFLINKFDLINTWQGIFLYFLILVITIFLIKRYFILNVDVIEIQNIEEKNMDK